MSALDGVLEVGDLVDVTIYEPTLPSWESTIEERIAAGRVYKEYRGERLTWIGTRDTGHLGWTITDSHAGGGAACPYSMSDETWSTIRHAEIDGALW